MISEVSCEGATTSTFFFLLAMAPLIQAKSLSEVVALAADPPAELGIECTRDSREPLVLYIARVPGSKGRSSALRSAASTWLTEYRSLDIFLTTMKPLQKVVTAADVQSCLYYVHVDSADDDRFSESKPVWPPEVREDGERGVLEGGSGGSLGGSEFRRKPVPVRREGALDKSDDYHCQVPDHQTGVAPNGQTFAVQEADIMPQIRPPSLESSVPHPFGPRSMQQRHHPVQRTAPEMSAGKPDGNVRRVPEPPPALPPRPPRGEHEVKNHNYNHRPHSWRAGPDPLTRNNGIHGSHQGASTPIRTPYTNGVANTRNPTGRQDMSLTLIRRHDGSQWNVGRISRTDEAADLHNAIKLDDTSAHEHGESGLYIDILTLGYEKFTAQSSRKDGRSEIYETGLSERSLQRVHTPDSSQRHEGTWFRRSIQNARAEKEVAKRRRNSGSGGSLFDRHGFRSSLDSPRTRDEKTGQGAAGNRRADPAPTRRAGERKSCYTFQSPWNGRCEFNFGLTNRSLRCKHVIDPSQSLFSSSTTKQTTTAQPQSTSMSELRFNLTSAKTSSGSSWPPSHQQPKRSAWFPRSKHQRRQQQQQLSSPRTSEEGIMPEQRRSPSRIHVDDRRNPPHQASSFDSRTQLDDTDTDNDAPTMDHHLPLLLLSLGQERAGGGFGGKEAKLGKLIVEPEGLKMLDLLVAANVALWWRVYERAWVG